MVGKIGNATFACGDAIILKRETLKLLPGDSKDCVVSKPALSGKQWVSGVQSQTLECEYSEILMESLR